MQKRKKKKKKKKKGKLFMGYFLEVFLFPVTQRAEKVKDFFFRKGRGKMLNKL